MSSVSGQPVQAVCPACDSGAARKEFVARDPLGGDSFPLVRCNDCGLTFVSPQPSPEELGEYYGSDYYGSRHPVLKDTVMNIRVRQIGPVGGTGKLLDIGCGGGDFLFECEKHGWQVSGVERGAAPVRTTPGGKTISVVDPADMNTLESDSFEAVTLWHVFEHLPDPRATLVEIRRVLAPGGRLVIEVPNFGGWQAKLGREDWFHVDVPRHLLHFDRPSLERLLRNQGFTPERWGTFSLEYDAFGLTQTLLNKVCRNPNHIFQILIRNPREKSLRDSLVSAVLFLPVLACSSLISFCAPLFGQGGVLRVTARSNS